MSQKETKTSKTQPTEQKAKRLKILQYSLLVIGLILTVVLPPWRVTWAQLNPFPKTIQDEADAAITYGFDGILVLTQDKDGDTELYASGWHDRDAEIDAYPEAYFKIGSINKLYNSVAATKLVAAGELDFDGTISQYFPEYADRIENSDEITLTMLIQHNSGIPDFSRLPGYWENPPDSELETLEMALDLPAEYEPGEGFNYSNTNYLLLTMLMDKKLGYSHLEFVQSEILDPLGLDDTYFSVNDLEDTDRLMSGYYVGVEEDLKMDYDSMVSTLEDTATLLRALNDGTIFNGDEPKLYPYEYDHNGLIPGFQSFSTFDQESERIVVTFINTSDFSDYQNYGSANAVHNRIVNRY